jgi:hypothetical protein
MGGLFSAGKIDIVIEGGSQLLFPGEIVKGFINIKTEGPFLSQEFVFSLIGMEHVQWTE